MCLFSLLVYVSLIFQQRHINVKCVCLNAYLCMSARHLNSVVLRKNSLFNFLFVYVSLTFEKYRIKE